MSLAQTPPKAPANKAVTGGTRLSRAAGGGLPCLGKIRDAQRAAPYERAHLVYVGAGVILPLFCPTDLHRAVRTRVGGSIPSLTSTSAHVNGAGSPGFPSVRQVVPLRGFS
jgi:hypothetical protein